MVVVEEPTWHGLKPWFDLHPNSTGLLKLTLAGEAILAGEPPVENIEAWS